LQDVADRAGVSRSTASSILNGARSSTRTSAATRERVRQAAAELAYRPNAVARSLRHQATHTIGFYNGFGYIDARNAFLSALIAGMHSQCDQHKYDLLIHRVSERDDKMAQFQEIISGKVDGVVLWTHMNDPLVRMVAERHFPAVAIADACPELPSVTADDEGGSRLVAERVAHAGHKRVLYRVPPVERMSCIRRHQAFIADAEKLGLQVVTGISADYTGTPSDEELRLIGLPEGERPTAIVCWCDGNALEMVRFFQTSGWAPGGWTNRFSVIGFDGFDVPWLPVKLTSVFVPWDTVASTAVDIVRKAITGDAVPLQTRIPVRMVEGATG
jgi:LacI family transcriptional regulator